jgi:hypothetical protein
MGAATAAAALVLGVVAGLLAAPVVLAVEAERTETLAARWRVRWLFGLVDVGSSPASAGRPAAKDSSARRTPRAAGGRSKGPRVGLAVLRTPGLRRRMRRLAGALLRRVTVDGFQLHMAFGFDSPADTGIAYGFLAPALALARARGLSVDCRPVFDEPHLSGRLSATMRVRPLSVAAPLVAFLVSPPVVRAARAAWRASR